VCIRKPGQTVHGIGTQNTILLTLDFSGTQSAQNYSRNIEGPQQPICTDPLLEHLSGVIAPYSENTFIPIYNELLSTAHTDTEAAGFLVLELLHKLNAEVFRREYSKRKPTETVCSKVLHYIQEHLEDSIRLEELAAMVHLDKSYLVRLFRDTYGQTPIQLLIRMRMELACDLIANTDLPIGQIALQCGYASPSYFSAEYKKHYGVTPAMHRNIR
jgi:AraC-like DNA-binding protein